MRQRELESAAVEFAKSLQINSQFPAAVTNHANCLREQGKSREAEEGYSHAIDLEVQEPKDVHEPRSHARGTDQVRAGAARLQEGS